METFSAAPHPVPETRPDERACRIGRVKFVALADEAAGDPAAPASPRDPVVAGPQPAARPFRLLQLLRRIASRVDGRPSAARP